MKRNKGKIDVVVKYFIPVTAGIETNVLETYSVLAKNGWDVTIHTSKDTYKEKDALPSEEFIRGLNIKRYSFGKFGFFPNINWQNSDLVCLHNFNIFPHLRILAFAFFLKIFKKKKYALVLTPHGGFSLDAVWNIYPFWQRIIKRMYHNVFGSWLINNIVDGVRAVSEWEREDMVARGVKKEMVNVIPNGIEDEAYLDVDKLASADIKRLVKGWGKYILRIGRIYPIKNDETIIKALPLLPKDFNFIIVGPQEVNQHKGYFDELEKLIIQLGLKDRVIFAGVIRGVDKYYVIKKSLTMTHMALWESFCNVVHEALSQGKIPIVANNTALPYLIKDGVNGYLVDTRDNLTLAKRINYLINNIDSKKFKDMSERNRKLGLEESWKCVAHKMDKFYRNLTNK